MLKRQIVFLTNVGKTQFILNTYTYTYSYTYAYTYTCSKHQTVVSKQSDHFLYMVREWFEFC